MILLIDNYDSFVYNLYQLIGQFESDIKVVRNDHITLEEIEDLHPAAIIISPGPGTPENAGISIDVIKRFYKDIPILGVCLGHQSIFKAFGGDVGYAKRVMHGKISDMNIMNHNDIFKDLPDTIPVGRYHSLAGDINTLPEVLEVLGITKDEEIMAIKHKTYPVYGLQFHPESILTKDGYTIIENFIKEIKQ